MYTQDLLDQGFSDTTLYEDHPIATRGKRFANYLIDYAAYLLLGVIIIFALEFTFPSVLDTALFQEENRGTDWLLGALLMLLYYPLMEGLTSGRSLGKLITKTRAVKRDGNLVSFEDCMIRTICRLVPFEALSFLGSEPVTGWHDKWSKTIVVDEKKKKGERTRWE